MVARVCVVVFVLEGKGKGGRSAKHPPPEVERPELLASKKNGALSLLGHAHKGGASGSLSTPFCSRTRRRHRLERPRRAPGGEPKEGERGGEWGALGVQRAAPLQAAACARVLPAPRPCVPMDVMVQKIMEATPRS